MKWKTSTCTSPSLPSLPFLCCIDGIYTHSMPKKSAFPPTTQALLRFSIYGVFTQTHECYPEHIRKRCTHFTPHASASMSLRNFLLYPLCIFLYIDIDERNTSKFRGMKSPQCRGEPFDHMFKNRSTEHPAIWRTLPASDDLHF